MDEHEGPFVEDRAHITALLSRQWSLSNSGDVEGAIKRAQERRHSRRRRLTVTGITVTIVAATIAVVSVVVPGSNPRQHIASPPSQPTTVPTTVPTGNVPKGSISQAFRRTVDGGAAVIRAFFLTGETEVSPANGVSPVPTQIPPDTLQVEATSPTGVVAPGSKSPPQVSALGLTGWGYYFGDPGQIVGVVWLYSGPDIQTTQLSVGGNVVDQMTPVQGWSVLAVPNPPTMVQVGGMSTNGAVVPQQTVELNSAGEPLTTPPYFVRTTSDGLLIRGGEDGSFVTMNVSNTWSGNIYDGIRACNLTTPDSIYAQPQDISGAAEGSPFDAVPVLSGPGIAEVRVIFADGGSDEMAPVKGLTILAHQGAYQATEAFGLDGSGSVVATQSLTTRPPDSGVPPCLR